MEIIIIKLHQMLLLIKKLYESEPNESGFWMTIIDKYTGREINLVENESGLNIY